MISIIVPTISGREHWLRRCMISYAMNTTSPYQIIVVKDHPTWGEAIQVGQEKADGGYLHFTADDIEAHLRWDVAAIKAVDSGHLPAPRILNTDGSLQSCGDASEHDDWAEVEFTRVPFLSRQQWEKIGPLPAIHYYADNWISHQGRVHGWPTVVRRGYLLTHHFAPEGRVDHRFGPDGAAYQKLIST